MSPLANHPVAKMNGLGNEIVTMDLRGTSFTVSPEEVRAIGRGKGLTFDQLMVLFDPRTKGTEAFMRIYNIDGSEAGACGNGTRCIAWTLMRGTNKTALTIETDAAMLDCTRNDELNFTIDMGQPRLGWNEIPLRDAMNDTRSIALPIAQDPALPPASAVSMGNPHAVFFVDDIDAHDLRNIGKVLEHHPMFPERANISIAQIISPEHILLKVWERGVGPTRACGSAACATLVAAVRAGRSARKATITLPGGDLVIEWRASDDHVLMTGPVELEFETRLDASLFEGAPA